MSYPVVMAAVETIGKQRMIPIKSWIEKGMEFEFVSDNVDKKMGVRDIRTGFHGEMKHMYSILAIFSRTPSSPARGSNTSLESINPDNILPTPENVLRVKQNLAILVSRVVCRYISCLKHFSVAIQSHITHKFSDQMAGKSDTFALDCSCQKMRPSTAT